MRNRLYKEIEHCLDLYPDTRNSDITLMIKIWQEFYGVKEGIFLTQLYELPREDNIKRIRAKIQNEEHKFLPTEWKIAKQRKINRERWEFELGYMTPDQAREANIQAKQAVDHLKEIAQEKPVKQKTIDKVREDLEKKGVI